MVPGVRPWFFAFWELSTDRHYPGGPIPHSSIQAWETPDKEFFRECMREADRAYLDWHSTPPEDKQPTKVFGPGVLGALHR